MRKASKRRGIGGGRERGFTLLETCIALLVLMFVSLGVASLFVYAIANNGTAGDRAMAIAVGQQMAEQLRSISYSDLEKYVPATGSTPNSVTSAGRSYQVAVSYAYMPSTATASTATQKTVSLTVTPVGGNGLLTTNAVRITVVRSTLEIGNYAK